MKIKTELMMCLSISFLVEFFGIIGEMSRVNVDVNNIALFSYEKNTNVNQARSQPYASTHVRTHCKGE